MRLFWLRRLLAMLRDLLGDRREPPISIERRVASSGLEIAVLRVCRGPRSLAELATRVELVDWAARAPGRELVLVRRARLRGRAGVE